MAGWQLLETSLGLVAGLGLAEHFVWGNIPITAKFVIHRGYLVFNGARH